MYGDLLNEGYRKAKVSARVTVRLESQSQMCVSCDSLRMERVGSSQPQSPTNSQETIRMLIPESKPREMPLFFFEKVCFLQIFVRMQSTVPA